MTQTNLPNSTVTYHPSGTVEVEVYDRKGNKLSVRNVFMSFNTVVVRVNELLELESPGDVGGDTP